jgi:hypothetical protein
MSIGVTAVNDAPTNVVPGTQNTFQDTSLVFSSAYGNTITVADVDAGANPIEVTLIASSGTVTLASTTGLTFVVGDGTADGSMTFTATVANINTALNGLRFDPNAGFQGTATLRIITDDLGNSGGGGALSDLDIVSIMVERAPVPVSPSGPLPPLDEILLTMAGEPASNGLSDSGVLGLSAVTVPTSATAPSADESPQDGAAVLRGGARDTSSDDLFPAEKPFPRADVSEFLPADPEALGDDGDNDRASPLTKRPFIKLQIPIKYAPGNIELEFDLPEAMWDLVDAMKQQMDEGGDSISQDGEIIITSVTGVTFAISVSYVSWLLRAGYLSASVLSFAPLWRQFDPLPLLAAKRDSRNKSADARDSHQSEDEEADKLFQRMPSSQAEPRGLPS